MNNGIIQTALTGLPLELEYRPHQIRDQSSTISESSTHPDVSSQQSGQMLSDEFECLLSVV